MSANAVDTRKSPILLDEHLMGGDINEKELAAMQRRAEEVAAQRLQQKENTQSKAYITAVTYTNGKGSPLSQLLRVSSNSSLGNRSPLCNSAENHFFSRDGYSPSRFA